MPLPNPPYDWDEDKRAANIAEHGLDFIAAYEFEWDSALVEVDDREDYGELREIAIGFIGARLCVLVFTQRDGRKRIISLRRAEQSDKRKYVESTK